jgi:protein involved in polysaccharide export with SLBB domain
VRPGDTIFVPAAGTVSTVGWVYHPTTMPINHNLSVIGAVAASGGPLFAADEHNVRIVRRQNNGQIAVMNVDIASIQEGSAADVPLRDGDIVDVEYAAYKIPGYALYYAAQGIVSFAPSALLFSGGL